MNELRLWQRELLGAVGCCVAPLGFEQNPKQQSMRKRTDFGHVVFHLSFVNHRSDFDVTADVGVRYDKVEELIHGDDKLLTKVERAETCTIGCELGNLSGGGQKRWTVGSKADIPGVTESVMVALTTVGLPYLEKFSNPDQVLETLSGDGPDSWLHSPLDGSRAKRAVAMAFLRKGTDAAVRLAQRKADFLESKRDFALRDFHLFVESLGLGEKGKGPGEGGRKGDGGSRIGDILN